MKNELAKVDKWFCDNGFKKPPNNGFESSSCFYATRHKITVSSIFGAPYGKVRITFMAQRPDGTIWVAKCCEAPTAEEAISQFQAQLKEVW